MRLMLKGEEGCIYREGLRTGWRIKGTSQLRASFALSQGQSLRGEDNFYRFEKA